MLVVGDRGRVPAEGGCRVDDDDVAVLIVEDDPDVLDVLRLLLTSCGHDHQILAASTLAEGRLAWYGRPDGVVVLDLRLPDSPTRTVAEVRSWQPTPAILAMTADDGHDAGHQAVRDGADEFIPKRELDTGTLHRLLGTTIERHGRHAAADGMHHELLSRVEDLDAYVAAISHDLRAPLAAAEMAVATIRHHPEAAALPDVLDDLLDRVDRLLKRGRAFADGLLDEARIGGESRAPLDLPDLIASATDLAGVDPSVVEVDRLPEDVWGRPMAITQILTNLIGNARRHADPDEPRVRVSGQRHPRAVLLCVEDNGPGIPEDQREQVFDAGATTTGSGHGLHTVRRQVASLGGKVWIDQNGHLPGARICVQLPARDRPALIPTTPDHELDG